MSNAGRELCVGVDLGTQGPRVVIAYAAGQVVGATSAATPRPPSSSRRQAPPGELVAAPTPYQDVTPSIRLAEGLSTAGLLDRNGDR